MTEKFLISTNQCPFVLKMQNSTAKAQIPFPGAGFPLCNNIITCFTPTYLVPFDKENGKTIAVVHKFITYDGGENRNLNDTSRAYLTADSQRIRYSDGQEIFDSPHLALLSKKERVENSTRSFAFSYFFTGWLSRLSKEKIWAYLTCQILFSKNSSVCCAVRYSLSTVAQHPCGTST